MVAQRISTVLNADKIIVIDKGRIVAQGTHKELMQTSPIYQEIYESQLGNGFHTEEAAGHPGRERDEMSFQSGSSTSSVRSMMHARRPADPGKIEKAQRPAPGGEGPAALSRCHSKPAWLIVFVFVLIYTVLGLVGPYLMGLAIDQFIATKQAAGLATIALWMLAVYLLNNLFQAIANWLMAGISQRALKQMRKDLFTHLQSLADRLLRPQPGRRVDEPPDQRYRRHQPGRLAECHLPARQCAVHGRHPGRHVRPGPLAGAGLPAGCPDHVLVHPVCRQLHPQGLPGLQKHLGELNGVMEESISGQKVVKAFRRNESVIEAFRAAATRRFSRLASMPTPMPCC